MILGLQRRFDELEKDRLCFLNEAQSMTDEQITFRPYPTHWNLAQVVQHLMLVEQTFLAHTTDEKYLTRKPKFHPWVGKILVWLYFRMEFKVKVPVKRAVPDESMSLTEAARLWEEKRNGLKNYFDSLDEMGARNKVFFHPFMGLQNSVEFLIFLKRHFDHHMKQVQRIKKSPYFPK
jgi:hypothetical protein